MWRRSVQAQGAIEYLLIVAVVVGVVGVAILFLTTTSPSAIITGSAERSGDNVVFVPSRSMMPTTISAGEWEWAIYRGATQVASGSGTKSLERGVSVVLTAPNAESGDEVKIKYKGTWFEAAIIR